MYELNKYQYSIGSAGKVLKSGKLLYGSGFRDLLFHGFLKEPIQFTRTVSK